MYGPERRRPEVRASTMLKKRKRYLSARRFHAITYLCFLAHHSGVQAAGTFLSDEGVLHQAAHCACNLSKWSKLLPRVLELERSVPGYLSPKELEE